MTRTLRSSAIATGSSQLPVIFTIGPRRPRQYHCVKYFLVACQLVAIVAQIVIMVLGYSQISGHCDNDLCPADDVTSGRRHLDDDQRRHLSVVLFGTSGAIIFISVIGIIGAIREAFPVMLAFAMVMVGAGGTSCVGTFGALSTANVAIGFFTAGLAFNYAYMIRASGISRYHGIL